MSCAICVYNETKREYGLESRFVIFPPKLLGKRSVDTKNLFFYYEEFGRQLYRVSAAASRPVVPLL